MLNGHFIKIGLVCVLGITACWEEKGEDPADQTTQTMIDDSATGGDFNPIGTFVSDSRQAGDLTQLVLKTNRTFHSATFVVCIAPPCDPVQEDGTYSISSRDSRRYITLFNVEGAVIDMYNYLWRESTLHLLRVSSRGETMATAPWLPMWLSTTAWCASPISVTEPTGDGLSDCDLQNLPIGPCAGEWTCVSNVCNWDCLSTY